MRNDSVPRTLAYKINLQVPTYFHTHPSSRYQLSCAPLLSRRPTHAKAAHICTQPRQGSEWGIFFRHPPNTSGAVLCCSLEGSDILNAFSSIARPERALYVWGGPFPGLVVLCKALKTSFLFPPETRR